MADPITEAKPTEPRSTSKPTRASSRNAAKPAAKAAAKAKPARGRAAAKAAPSEEPEPSASDHMADQDAAAAGAAPPPAAAEDAAAAEAAAPVDGADASAEVGGATDADVADDNAAAEPKTAPKKGGKRVSAAAAAAAAAGAEDSPAVLRAKAALEKALAENKDGAERGASPAGEPSTSAGDSALAEVGPGSVMQEERRLRAEREATAAAEAAGAAKAIKEQIPLNGSQWDKLDALLRQTTAYTAFLSEQMAASDAANDAEAAAAAGGQKGGKGGAGTKRGAGGAAKGGRGGKRAKQENGAAAVHATQELLPLMKGEMRDYQLKGVRWLISLYTNGLNGILADEMGLGKTVQTIGFLSHLKSKGINGPFLVLGPLSTLPNWMNEFVRWCPDIEPLLYHGNQEERRAMQSGPLAPGSKGFKSVAAVVTSYEIAMRDIKFLARTRWKYIIVDEGHRLKNFNSKLIKDLKTVPSENKLLLTGTPLQNNLSELWSLLNFLLPDVFTSLKDFEDWFDFSALSESGGSASIVAAEQRNKVVSKLHGILKPFLLRRVKQDVETALPGKAEIILYAGMSDTQRRLNDELLNRTINETMAKAANGQSGAVARLNNMLMQMRKNANHPDLITSAFEQNIMYPPAEELVSESGKMQLLERMLKALHKGGHKVLIFSQMTKMLDLLHYFLEERGFSPCRIDGSIPWQERQADMKAFNEDAERFVFLLSTRAGGLGINLTSADTVIIYDSDWNPHADLQAMDRCHRIGQTRPVLVFRLATGNSIEGRMLARAGSKLALEKLVIKRGAFLDVSKEVGGMGADELVALLKPKEESRDDPQSAVVSEKMLTTLLDRKFMEDGKKAPYAPAGPGYQVVAQMDRSGLLKGVE